MFRLEFSLLGRSVCIEFRFKCVKRKNIAGGMNMPDTSTAEAKTPVESSPVKRNFISRFLSPKTTGTSRPPAPTPYSVFERDVQGINNRRKVSAEARISDGKLNIESYEPIDLGSIDSAVFTPSPESDKSVDLIIRVRHPLERRISKRYLGTFNIDSEVFQKTKDILHDIAIPVTNLFSSGIVNSPPNLTP